jgi:hypothetical protein
LGRLATNIFVSLHIVELIDKIYKRINLSRFYPASVALVSRLFSTGGAPGLQACQGMVAAREKKILLTGQF